MISSGWTNPTPWDTEREEDEASLEKRLNRWLQRLKNPQTAVFNLHAPPFSSGLDDAPELTSDMRLAYAGQSLIPVGSKSTLKVIEKYAPCWACTAISMKAAAAARSRRLVHQCWQHVRARYPARSGDRPASQKSRQLYPDFRINVDNSAVEV
jgi:hypothetical protein